MTTFSVLDGIIVGIYLLGCIVAGLMVRKYVGGVNDFLVADRQVNVFLGIASLAATEFGIVTCMYTAQNGYDKGFAGAIPGVLLAVAMLVVGLTGFCIKPLRGAGVITIPELFAQRYGPRVRWMSGLVIVLGGLLNMGVFLRTGGDFLVTVCGLDPRYLEVTMTVLLVGVAAYTILGGMVAVLVTDYLQFIVMSIGLLAVTVLIFWRVGWANLVEAVNTHCGAGGFNPFTHEGMGPAYLVFNTLVALAVVLTWQTMVQRVLAAKDSRTGRRIYLGTSPFFVCRFLLPAIWGIAALATVPAAAVDENSLLAMPRFLAGFLPVGLMGLLIAAMLAADMSTNAAYMLSWASVIFNDIMAPWHRHRWPAARALLCNRLIVGAIGVFLLVYGLWYPLKQDLWTYLMVTGSIYLASMSILLVACCYWKRANSWGAAAAITVGALMPVAYLVLEQIPRTAPLVADRIGPYTWGIMTYALTAAAMIVGSLARPVTPRPHRKAAP